MIVNVYDTNDNYITELRCSCCLPRVGETVNFHAEVFYRAVVMAVEHIYLGEGEHEEVNLEVVVKEIF